MPIDTSGILSDQLERAKARAEKAVAAKNWADAAQALRQCSSLMQQYAQLALDPRVRAMRIEKAVEFGEQADRARDGRMARALTPRAAPEASGGEDSNHTAAMEALITKIDVNWDDIGGLEATKREIRTAYGIAMAKAPAGVKIKSVRNLLLYGPPGTGKTLLAAAVSNSLDATFFNVKLGEILNKYFGESPRIISALYAVANEHAPSVIFLDEIEALVPPRDSGSEGGAERRVVSAMLVELSGLAQKGDDRFVMTIGATNLPWLIDKAMISRFNRAIYVPLPDLAAREAILRIQLERSGHKLEQSYAELARKTDGYSGRELEKLCADAVNRMIGRVNPDLLEAVDAGRVHAGDYQLKVAAITPAEIEASLEAVPAMTDRASLDEYDKYRKARD